MKGLAPRSRSLLAVVAMVLAARACLTPSFVAPRTAPAQPVMALSLAQVLAPAPASAEVNQEAYFAAAGIDPNEVRGEMIDQMSDTDAALLGATDFFWGIMVPFTAGLGLVYGIAISTGNLEGPFPTEDGEQKS
ncbi:kif19 [Symbiodinium natans]|uniref:Kif19 protein n=1 Tax=Symbiodinium natans TaxID=878477 RepID=A0A812QYB6_9DINO|nr:kif19 [Symbiodinium natans]